MLVYILDIIVVVGLSIICERIPAIKRNKYIKNIIKILIILIPSIIAGIRYNVGTDYDLVYKPIYESAKLNIYTNRRRTIEFGYILLNKIGIIFNSFSLVMFLSALITNTFFILGIYQYKDKINIPMAISIYLLMYYQLTFNAVRQCIGMSIIFWALKFLNNKYDTSQERILGILDFFLSVAIAMTFHKTAIIAIALPALYYLFNNTKYKKAQKIFLLIMLVCIINSGYIAKLMSYIPALRYYANYLYSPKDIKISVWYFIKVLPVLMPAVLFKNQLSQNKDIKAIFYFTLIGGLLLLLSYFTASFGERIALYFIIMQIILVPFYIEQSKNEEYTNRINSKLNLNLNKKTFFISVLITYVIFFSTYWYHDYVYKNMNETIPYKTVFQKD